MDNKPPAAYTVMLIDCTHVPGLARPGVRSRIRQLFKRLVMFSYRMSHGAIIYHSMCILATDSHMSIMLTFVLSSEGAACRPM